MIHNILRAKYQKWIMLSRWCKHDIGNSLIQVLVSGDLSEFILQCQERQTEPLSKLFEWSCLQNMVSTFWANNNNTLDWHYLWRTTSVPYLEVAFVPPVLGQRVPQLLITPHCLQHMGSCLRFTCWLAEEGPPHPKKRKLVEEVTSPNRKTVTAGRASEAPLQSISSFKDFWVPRAVSGSSF